MPQTGPDLVGAGYPISRPLLALLGGNGNISQPNNPIRSNLDFAMGGLIDGSTSGSAASGSVNAIAVPVVPGDVITKISLLVGGTSAASANVTNLWAALYTGTGSAPGTTNAQPTLIAATASLSATNVPSSTRLDFTFATPQTITSLNAPFGFVYAAYSATIASASPNATTPSLLSVSAASAGQYLYYGTSPFAMFMTSNGGTGSVVPTSLGAAVRAANPPVVLLS